jgi:hypothetical protein
LRALLRALAALDLEVCTADLRERVLGAVQTARHEHALLHVDRQLAPLPGQHEVFSVRRTRRIEDLEDSHAALYADSRTA